MTQIGVDRGVQLDGAITSGGRRAALAQPAPRRPRSPRRALGVQARGAARAAHAQAPARAARAAQRHRTQRRLARPTTAHPYTDVCMH